MKINGYEHEYGYLSIHHASYLHNIFLFLILYMLIMDFIKYIIIKIIKGNILYLICLIKGDFIFVIKGNILYLICLKLSIIFLIVR